MPILAQNNLGTLSMAMLYSSRLRINLFNVFVKPPTLVIGGLCSVYLEYFAILPNEEVATCPSPLQSAVPTRTFCEWPD